MKNKFAAIGFTYLAGLICSSFLGAVPSLVFCCVAIVTAVVFAILKKSSLCAVFMIFGISLAVYTVYTALVYDKVIANEGKTLDITAAVQDVNEIGNDIAIYEVTAQLDGVETGFSIFSSDIGAQIGDRLSFTAHFSELSDNTNFAEKTYYKTKGIFLDATVKSPISIERDEGFNLTRELTNFNSFIAERISTYLPDDEGALLRAFFLGDKSALSNDLENNIRYSGISHFSAVSGLHLTIISHILMLLFSLTPFKYLRRIKFLTLTSLILMFMIFFRLSQSVMRAGIMLIVYYGAELLRRKPSTINSMGVAAFLIVLFNPYACLDPGLLLSLAGTFGIGVVAPIVKKSLRRVRFGKVISFFASLLAPTLCTLPLVAIFFGGVSSVGLIANILLYPFFLVAMFCVVLFIFLGGNGEALMFGAGVCAKAMLAIINALGELKFSYVSLDYHFTVPLLLISCAAVTFIHLVLKNVSRTAMSVAACVCTLVCTITFAHVTNYSRTELHVFSDGENAAVIVREKNNAAVIATDDSPELCAEIKRYMKINYVEKLSVLCLLENKSNNMSELKAIPTEYLITDENEMDITVGDILKIDLKSDCCTLVVQDVSLCISKISEPVLNGQMLLYGLKRTSPCFEGVNLVLYSNKNVDADDKNEINLYYNKFTYYVEGDLLTVH